MCHVKADHFYYSFLPHVALRADDQGGRLTQHPEFDGTDLTEKTISRLSETARRLTNLWGEVRLVLLQVECCPENVKFFLCPYCTLVSLVEKEVACHVFDCHLQFSFIS
jgi:hypothetical protein